MIETEPLLEKKSQPVGEAATTQTNNYTEGVSAKQRFKSCAKVRASVSLACVRKTPVGRCV